MGATAQCLDPSSTSVQLPVSHNQTDSDHPSYLVSVCLKYLGICGHQSSHRLSSWTLYRL